MGGTGPNTEVCGGYREEAGRKRMKILELWEARQAGRKSPGEMVEAKGHQVGRREHNLKAHYKGSRLFHPGKVGEVSRSEK